MGFHAAVLDIFDGLRLRAAQPAHAADRSTAPLRAAVARPLMGAVRRAEGEAGALRGALQMHSLRHRWRATGADSYRRLGPLVGPPPRKPLGSAAPRNAGWNLVHLGWCSKVQCSGAESKQCRGSCERGLGQQTPRTIVVLLFTSTIGAAMLAANMLLSMPSLRKRRAPNPSLEPTRYGSRRLAAPGYVVHCPCAAKRRLP